MADYIDVTNHPGLRGGCTRDDDDCTMLWYTGTHEQILAAGIVPPSALIRTPKGKGVPRSKGRFDVDGDQVCTELYFGTAAGIPVPRARVILWKPMDRALKLPSAAQAIAAAREKWAETARRNREYERAHALEVRPSGFTLQ